MNDLNVDLNNPIFEIIYQIYPNRQQHLTTTPLTFCSPSLTNSNTRETGNTTTHTAAHQNTKRNNQHVIEQVRCAIQITTTFNTKVTLISYKHNLFLHTHTHTTTKTTEELYYTTGTESKHRLQIRR
jgi:hypothetical protein